MERLNIHEYLFYDKINYNLLKIYVNIQYFRKENINTSEIGTCPNMAEVNTNEIDKYEVLSQQMILLSKNVEKAVNSMPSLCMDIMSNCMQKIDKVLELHNKKESSKEMKK